MKTAVIVFPGSNCDRDLAVALEAVTGVKPAMVWHAETELPDGIGFVAVPGGFPDEIVNDLDAQVGVFAMPGQTPEDKPVLGGGDLAGLFNQENEAAQDLMAFLASADFGTNGYAENGRGTNGRTEPVRRPNGTVQPRSGDQSDPVST